MELIHYTTQRQLAPRAYDQIFWLKPTGLWVSVNDAWAQWCKAESFGWSRRMRAYRIDVRRSAAILRLNTVAKVQAFHQRYAIRERYPRYPLTFAPIDWQRVAVSYDGILINPYRYALRTTLVWYHAWDVASGCIWNWRAVTRVIPRS